MSLGWHDPVVDDVCAGYCSEDGLDVERFADPDANTAKFILKLLLDRTGQQQVFCCLRYLTGCVKKINEHSIYKLDVQVKKVCHENTIFLHVATTYKQIQYGYIKYIKLAIRQLFQKSNFCTVLTVQKLDININNIRNLSNMLWNSMKCIMLRNAAPSFDWRKSLKEGTGPIQVIESRI